MQAPHFAAVLTLTLPGKRSPRRAVPCRTRCHCTANPQRPQYGIVAFWGMTEAQEQELLAGVLAARGAATQVVDEEDRQVG